MAEQITHDVVKEAQSMGEPSPIDDSVATTQLLSAGEGQTPQTSSEVPATAIETKATIEDAFVGGASEAEAVPAPAPALVGDGDVDRHLHLPADDTAIVDLSGGSDTDSSRPDGLEASKADHGHVRSDSIKKPATFKSVSVTKSFLAKAATATPGAKGADSRGSSPASGVATTPLSARPRLVAKSGSSGLTPRSGLASTPATGPDASKVWNKNRPIAPIPPKQLTDEELKQQYGIHLATRLQAGEASKESTWADIDDDEDDWVPESVEWMDGTKSSVQTGELPPEAGVPADAAAPAEVQAQVVQATPVPIIAQRPSSTGGTKTILKPAAHAQSPANLQKPTNGLVLKSGSEKPTLVVKPSVPTPVKSPWATLPPVNKVPPVAPPVQPPPQSRFAQQDPHGFESLPPSATAREIAADDFNRTWHDEQTPHRALYDSKSGRYEPVNDTRRNSTRDHGYRQPAVLQRPGQQESRGGPAEPSAAFQTHRSGAEGGWGRRRASSSLSAGSGNFARRMSMSRPGEVGPVVHDTHSQRRESSSVNGSAVSPADQFRAGVPQDARTFASPTMSHLSRPSPGSSHAQPILSEAGDANQPAATEAPADSNEDPVAIQQRLMRGRLERARQAKQEEREREEQEAAARAERLRLKVASLAPTLPSVPTAEVDGVGAKDALPKPAVEQAAYTIQARPSAEHQQQPQQRSPSKHASAVKPQIPPTDGETAQFGLIKLHPSQSVRKGASDAKFANRQQPLQPQANHSPRAEGARHQARHGQPVQGTQKTDASSVDASDRAIGRIMEDGEKLFANEATWTQGAAHQAKAGGNIWGTGLGTLGNGTFTTSDGQDRQEAFSMRAGGGLPGPRYGGLPGVGDPNAQVGVDAWTRLSKELPERERQEAEQARQKLQQVKQSGYNTDARIQVTHRKTDPATGKVIGDSLSTNRNDNLVYAAQGGVNGAVGGNKPLANAANAVAPPGGLHPSLSRAVGAERVHGHTGQAGAKPSSKFAQFFEHRSGSNSPPPPDALNNELLDGNPRAPGVKLPAPKPQVKLPGASSSNTSPSEQPSVPIFNNAMAVQALASRASVPIAQQPDWHSRFRNLLSDRPVNVAAAAARGWPAAGAVQPITSDSRPMLEVVGSTAQSLATVSLPTSSPTYVRSRAFFAIDESGSVTSKTTAEEDLLDDRQFGSLPAVRVPKHGYTNQRFADFPKGPPPSYGRAGNLRFDPTRPEHALTALAISLMMFETQRQGGNGGKHRIAKIKLPGMKAEKSRQLPRSGGDGKHGEGSRRHFSGSGGRGGRGRGGHHAPRGAAAGSA